ncbi:hypothetical protein A4R29_11175 [Mesorhizobium ciceri biovar biserrulae]|uniref:DUF768 domain-containing protein n=2 Tax=Mesorhizobium ciceri TaxID=39645 RepID=UPI0007A93F70|nr:hypothetical protein A4R29_11175 [Mesorhizobium ciceri biovar biserrulae]
MAALPHGWEQLKGAGWDIWLSYYRAMPKYRWAIWRPRLGADLHAPYTKGKVHPSEDAARAALMEIVQATDWWLPIGADVISVDKLTNKMLADAKARGITRSEIEEDTPHPSGPSSTRLSATIQACRSSFPATEFYATNSTKTEGELGGKERGTDKAWPRGA